MRKVEITAQDLRADRLLAEARASGGDPLRLAHPFGISNGAAIRYCVGLNQITTADASRPGLSASPAPGRSPGMPPGQ